MTEAMLTSDEAHAPAPSGWYERLDEIVAWAQNQTFKIQDFGEAYDE